MKHLSIINPSEEARAMAFHLGRERVREGDEAPPLREPVAPVLDCAAELRTAELEHVMSEVPA